MAFEGLKVFLQDAACLVGIGAEKVVEKVTSDEFKESVKQTTQKVYDQAEKQQGQAIKRMETKQKEYESKFENTSTENLKQMQSLLQSDEGNTWAKGAIDDELAKRGER